MKTLTTLALACSLGLALAGCGQKDDTLKFGIGGPITGSDAAFGAQLKQGAEPAIADINEAGGILGKKNSARGGGHAGDPARGGSVRNHFGAYRAK